jgi:uncharacterized protein with FMN-binding domain
MKRAIIVGASTVTGLAAVLLLNPDGAPESVASSSAVAPDGAGTATDGAGSTSDSRATPDSAPTTGGSSATGSGSASSADGGAADNRSSSGTFAGDAVQVRNFGIMAVQVTTSGGRVTDVTALQVPDWDRKSQMINSYAVPQLTASALKSQSGDVSYVSGATFTSMAFSQSLQSALTKAGLA